MLVLLCFRFFGESVFFLCVSHWSFWFFNKSVFSAGKRKKCLQRRVFSCHTCRITLKSFNNLRSTAWPRSPSMLQWYPLYFSVTISNFFYYYYFFSFLLCFLLYPCLVDLHLLDGSHLIWNKFQILFLCFSFFSLCSSFLLYSEVSMEQMGENKIKIKFVSYNYVHVCT